MSTHWQEGIQDQIDKERLARKILGVSEDADRVAIKKAFWLLAMKHHPDKQPGDSDARDRFLDLVNAYECLMKGETRGWHPTEDDAPPEEESIGEYLAGDWGYFCWWRDNYMGDEELPAERSRERRKRPQRPDSRPGDWW